VEQFRILTKRQRQRVQEVIMATARVTKITSASPKGFQEAAEEGLQRATKSLRGVTGFEVASLKGKVENGKITEYRVTMEVTFVLE
jgi:dodecin